MVMKKGGLWIIWLTVVIMLTYVKGKGAVLHKVGGKSGWTENVNFTEWAVQETFYVGDWLYFGFDKHRYNVLQVNQTSYEKCNANDFIKNITTGGGRDVFNLTEAKPFYFLSGGGYCYNGMRLAVDVVEFVPPAPTPAGNDTPAFFAAHSIPSVLLAIALLWAST